MDFDRILELLPDFAQGRLKGTDETAVALAVEQSESLKAELARLQAYFKALESLPEVKAPADFLVKVNAKIDSRKGFLRRVLFPVWPRLPLELAGLAVTVVLVVMIFNPFTYRNVPEEILKEPGGGWPELGEQPLPQAAASADAREEEEEEEKGFAPAPEPKAERRARLTQAPVTTRVSPDVSPRSSSPARPAPVIAPAIQPSAPRSAVADKVTAFAPEPPLEKDAEAQYKEKSQAVYAASPVPAAAPPPPAPSAMSGAGQGPVAKTDDVALERRAIKKETEAISMMTMVIDDRTIARGDIATGRRVRSRELNEVAASKSAAKPAPAPTPSPVYESVPEKAFAMVENIVRSHGGTITLRSRMETPNPQRTYVVSLPRGKFDVVRDELKAMGAVKDIDLNLDTSSAERVTFRLGVTID